jgi:hypothetical protein
MSKLQKAGKNILKAEVSHISIHGLWICIEDQEYFLPFKTYPWFKDATVDEIQNMILLHGKHLYWPELDIDLTLDSLKSPERYPLLYKNT